MASLRERYKVAWDDGEPVEVHTTVKDLITAADSLTPGKTQNIISLETTLIYCALRRAGADVPSYEEWVLVLDMYEKMPTAVVIEGPTQPAALPAEPSQYRASQALTGEPGLNAMTTEHSSLLSSS
jgi:hypothetical protein